MFVINFSETIESQKETISKYESRLRDLVRAYKGVVKEKDALQKSLSAIGSTEEGQDQGLQEEEDNKTDDASSTTSER